MQGYPAGWTAWGSARIEVPRRKGGKPGTRLLTEFQTVGHSRAKRLKALGNAVVPQQAAAAIRDLLSIEVPALSPVSTTREGAAA